MLRSIARLEPVGDGLRQVIEIVVSDGYHPARIEARAGVPIRLVFLRRDDHACTDRVVFSEPRLERRLAPYATTVVDLPPAGGREIRFTCGMGQYRGRIELLSPQASGTGTRIRALAPLARMAIVAVAAASGAALVGGATNPERAFLAVIAVAAVLGILVARRRSAVRPHYRP
jgi:Cu+-exporting ATPase